MKKKLLCLAAMATVAITVTVGISKKTDKDKFSNLSLANIEALAAGETSESDCSDSCKEWSGNSGGGIACDCKRYTGKCKNRC